MNLVVDVDDVAHHREQVLLDALDDLAVDEGVGRGVAEFELHSALLLDDADVEIGVLLQYRQAVVDIVAGVQHRQGAASEQVVQALLAAVEQACNLQPGQHVEVVFGGDPNGLDRFCHLLCQ